MIVIKVLQEKKNRMIILSQPNLALQVTLTQAKATFNKIKVPKQIILNQSL